MTVALMRSRTISLSAATLASGRVERLQDRNPRASLAAWSVDCEVDRVAKLLDSSSVLSAGSQSFLPKLRLLLGEVIGIQSLGSRFVFVDPRAEIFRAQTGKSKEEVCKIALGIDDNRGYAIDCGFFQKPDTQSGLAATGHADAHRMRHQIFRFVE